MKDDDAPLADLELPGMGGALPPVDDDAEGGADLELDLPGAGLERPGAEAAPESDLELDLPSGEPDRADADLELDLPGMSAPAAPKPAPQVIDGPWRDAEQLRRWALKAQDEEAWHPFVLLGEAATVSLAQARALWEACNAYLRRLAEVGGQRGLLATLVRDDPAFRRLRDLDEARWTQEREAWRWARPLWHELVRDAQRIARDGRLTEDEAEDLQAWAQRFGVPPATLDRWITERVDPRWGQLERVAADPGGMHLKLIPGVTITSAQQFSEVARSSEERWRQASEVMETLRVILRNITGPEADELRAAVEAGAARARAFAESSGRRFGEGEVNRLWLQCALWVLDERPVLALPDPWDAQIARSPEDLLELVDAQPSRLVDALESGLLAAWLEAQRSHPELARRLASNEDPPLVALWGLLHALGEPRLVFGPVAVRSGDALVEALDAGDPAVEKAFDELLHLRVLQDWARVTGQSATRDAATRAARGQNPEHRRRVFCWALGSPALVPGVVQPIDLVSLLRDEPERFERLLGDGSISAWAMARGFATGPFQEDQGWRVGRRRHELLWSLGLKPLVVRGVAFETPEALIERLSRADEDAAGLLLHAEPLQSDGTMRRWLGLHGRGAAAPKELDDPAALRFALWRAGLGPFHHVDTGWIADPAALAEWGEARPEALLRVLGDSAAAWLGITAPQVFTGVMKAMRDNEDPRDTLEQVMRALGRPAPTLEMSAERLDLGRILEGQTREAEVVLRNTSARGLLKLRLGEAMDEQLELHLAGTSAQEPVRYLKPGEHVALRVLVKVKPGGSSRGEDGVTVYVDGEPRALPVRYSSSFDLTGAVRTTAIYTVTSAALMLGWRGLLAYAAGDAILAADGGALTSLDVIVAQPEGQALARLALVVVSLCVGGPLALLAVARAVKK